MISKKKIKRFKELYKDVKPIIIKAIPVHGSHAHAKKKKINESKELNEATEKSPVSEWVRSGFRKRDEHHKSLTDHYSKHNKLNFNSDIDTYTSNSSINRRLIRDNLRPHDDRHIKGLDKYLSEAPELPHDIETYHGLSGWHPGMESHKHPERHIQIPHYVSSSLCRDIARGFGGSDKKINDKSDKRKSYHILKIKAKKGQKAGAYVDSHSRNSGEREFLLKRNSKFKIERKPEIYKDRNSPFATPKQSNPHLYVWTAHLLDED